MADRLDLMFGRFASWSRKVANVNRRRGRWWLFAIEHVSLALTRTCSMLLITVIQDTIRQAFRLKNKEKTSKHFFISGPRIETLHFLPMHSTSDWNVILNRPTLPHNGLILPWRRSTIWSCHSLGSCLRSETFLPKGSEHPPPQCKRSDQLIA